MTFFALQFVPLRPPSLPRQSPLSFLRLGPDVNCPVRVRRQTARAHYLRDRNAPNGSRRQVDGYSIKDGFEGGRATIAERRSKTKHNMNDSHGRCLNLCNFGCESECSHDVRDTNLAYGSPSPSFHCMAAPLSLFHVLQNRRNGMEWSCLPWLPGWQSHNYAFLSRHEGRSRPRAARSLR